MLQLLTKKYSVNHDSYIRANARELIISYSIVIYQHNTAHQPGDLVVNFFFFLSFKKGLCERLPVSFNTAFSWIRSDPVDLTAWT